MSTGEKKIFDYLVQMWKCTVMETVLSRGWLLLEIFPYEVDYNLAYIQVEANQL